MSFLIGTGASLQIGKESSFGTAVTPSALVDITSESIKVSVEKSDEGSLLASKHLALETFLEYQLLAVSVLY